MTGYLIIDAQAVLALQSRPCWSSNEQLWVLELLPPSLMLRSFLSLRLGLKFQAATVKSDLG